MSIVKLYNKKTGVTYVYESESYWDKEKQQPRNRRRLIGKIDPLTGEVVPTGSPGRKKKDVPEPASGGPEPGDYGELLRRIESKDEEIADLRSRIGELEHRCDRYRSLLDRLRSMLDSSEV